MTCGRLEKSVEDLRAEIAAGGDDPLDNGLTPDENRRLIVSEDEQEIRSLLSKGIRRIHPRVPERDSSDR